MAATVAVATSVTLRWSESARGRAVPSAEALAPSLAVFLKIIGVPVRKTGVRTRAAPSWIAAIFALRG